MGFDLGAAEVEATAAPFEFSYGGVDYSVRCALEWETAKALNDEASDPERRAQLIFGEELFAELVAAGLTDVGFVALMEAYGKHRGATDPESRASTVSSPSKVKR